MLTPSPLPGISLGLGSLTAAGYVVRAIGQPPTIRTSSSGQLVQPPGTAIFTDSFDGSTLDTTNRWQTPVTAGTGAVVQSSGNLVCSVGTTASNAAAASTQESWASLGSGYNTFAGVLVFESAIQLNTHRFYGKGTPNASFTAATPLANAVGFELDIDGLLKCVTYNVNVRTVWATFTPPSDGAGHLYAIEARSNNVYFFIDDLSQPAAIASGSLMQTSRLPMRMHAINHTTAPAATPTFVMSGTAILDPTNSLQTAWNGVSISALRQPSKFVNQNGVIIGTETTIWTPAAGLRFRLMGYVLTSTVAAGNILLKDGTGGSTILVIPAQAVGVPINSTPMGNGILSVAANNVLTATGVATQAISGYVFGTEE